MGIGEIAFLVGLIILLAGFILVFINTIKNSTRINLTRRGVVLGMLSCPICLIGIVTETVL